MESNKILSKLENVIKQLKEVSNSSTIDNKEKLSEIQLKESYLISKIVKYFNKILSYNLNKNYLNNKENNNHFWNYISKHLNNHVVRFCEIYDYEENNINIDNILLQKGKNWIFISILEKLFNDSINEIYKQGWDKLYYEEDSLLIQYKSQIITILKELNEINFIHINSKEYDKYLEYIKNIGKNAIINKDSKLTIFSSFSRISSSEINMQYKETPPQFISKESKITFNNYQNKFIDEDDIKEGFISGKNSFILKYKKSRIKNESFYVKNIGNFINHINDNFYTFEEKKEDENNNTSFERKSSINSFEMEEIYTNSTLILNPKISIYLPIDDLYKEKKTIIIEKNSENYEKKHKSENNKISNSSILYLNNYYQKGYYYKFFKLNLNFRPISLKEQNYQCYICYKRIGNLLGVPTEQVYWCSYYLKFVCKNCIDDEYSIIPQLILKKSCFDKFSISKKAKKNLFTWYDKPVIYFRKNDKLLKNFSLLNKIIIIKEIINNIFNYMKCENKFIVIDNIFGEYKYIALKEYLFSLKDLVEINNGKFFEKINSFKNKLLNHLNEECKECKYEGEYCIICSSKEKIFLYNTKEIYYCNICDKSFHKKCIQFTNHSNHNC